MISSTTARLPTGPTIVLCISAIVLVSLLLAPNRGLVWRWLRHQRNRRQIRGETVLRDLYELASQHDDPNHGHSIAVLRAMNRSRGGVAVSLDQLERKSWVRQVDTDEWALTPSGLSKVEQLIGRQREVST